MTGGECMWIERHKIRQIASELLMYRPVSYKVTSSNSRALVLCSPQGPWIMVVFAISNRIGFYLTSGISALIVLSIISSLTFFTAIAKYGHVEVRAFATPRITCGTWRSQKCCPSWEIRFLTFKLKIRAITSCLWCDLSLKLCWIGRCSIHVRDVSVRLCISWGEPLNHIDRTGLDDVARSLKFSAFTEWIVGKSPVV